MRDNVCSIHLQVPFLGIQEKKKTEHPIGGKVLNLISNVSRSRGRGARQNIKPSSHLITSPLSHLFTGRHPSSRSPDWIHQTRFGRRTNRFLCLSLSLSTKKMELGKTREAGWKIYRRPLEAILERERALEWSRACVIYPGFET